MKRSQQYQNEKCQFLFNFLRTVYEIIKRWTIFKILLEIPNETLSLLVLVINNSDHDKEILVIHGCLMWDKWNWLPPFLWKILLHHLRYFGKIQLHLTTFIPRLSPAFYFLQMRQIRIPSFIFCTSMQQVSALLLIPLNKRNWCECVRCENRLSI